MSFPNNNDGPFMQNSRGPGLLRRLLGGGSSDPTAPHTHNDLSTSDMHRESLDRTAQSTPVTPKSSPFGTIGTDTFNGSPTDTQRPLAIRTILWLVRHPRIAITIGALVLVFIGQFGDGRSRVDEATAGLQDLQQGIEEGTFSSSDIDVAVPEIDIPAPSDPLAQPGGMADTSEYRGTIMEITGDQVLVASGTTASTWTIPSSSVRATVARNVGEDVLLHLQYRGATTYVIGVEGPNASLVPPTAPAAPTPPS